MNSLLALLLFLSLPLLSLRAQDQLPDAPAVHSLSADCDSLGLYSQRADTIALPYIIFPAAFRGVKENRLTDSHGALTPFLEKLRMVRLEAEEDSVRVLHVGDSHIRGHIFPQTAGDGLKRSFGAVSYVDMGINGAFCTTFTRTDRVQQIAAMRPDLLILSFGTNESHGRRYDPDLHYQQMDDLLRMLRESLPDVPILLTTPPGSYESFRQRRRRRSYQINPRTATAARTICRFAEARGLAVWDVYEIIGGSTRACLNWQETGLMRPDHVHYMPDGYKLQGELLWQAIIKAYNERQAD